MLYKDCSTGYLNNSITVEFNFTLISNSELREDYINCILIFSTEIDNRLLLKKGTIEIFDNNFLLTNKSIDIKTTNKDESPNINKQHIEEFLNFYCSPMSKLRVKLIIDNVEDISKSDTILNLQVDVLANSNISLSK